MLGNAPDIPRPNLRWSSSHWSGVRCAIGVVGCCLLFLLTMLAQGIRARRGLILYESSPNSSPVVLIDGGIEAAVNNSAYQVEFYYESRETASDPEPDDQREFPEFDAHKHGNRRPSLMIAVVEKHQQSCPGVPVIEWLPNRTPVGGTADSDFTGVQRDIAPAKTLDVGARLRPETKHVVVVDGTTPFDQEQLGAVQRQQKSYQGPLDISYATNFMTPDLLNRLRHLPPHTVVLLGALATDGAGNRHTTDQSHSMIATFEFDRRALRRPGMKETALPPGSLVLNRPPTIWEPYQPYGIAVIFVLLVQSVAILALLWHRARSRKAEAELLRSNERLRVSIKTGKSVGWDWDLASGRVCWFGDLNTILGIPSDTFSTEMEDFYHYVHPGDLSAVARAVEDAKQSRRPYAAEFRFVREDGRICWLTTRGAFDYDASGRPVRMRGMAVSITEVRESEERFRLVANTAPVMIWMTDPDKLCTYVNQTRLDFTGRSLDQELGEGWLAGLHPEDMQECLEGCNYAFERRKPHEMEYRLRRHDGEYRWILDFSVPRFDAGGSFAGYIGSGIDVTARKQAEDVLAGVSRKLIEVHEQERRRIARHLHDDISQRLALLVFEIGELQEDCSGSDEERKRRFAEISAQTAEITTGVQSISRQLHSPQLEYLGVVVAMQSFCRDFSKREGMEVDFANGQIPHSVPYEVSLCLFRILQEALQNAAQHSNVRHFEVRLEASSNQLHLTVTDRGAGFDPEVAMGKGGLGLISMQERVRLVNGTMKIQSQPMAGTKVKVHVPLGSANASERAAS
jgi:PAS domain S-box-containing protein